MRLFFFGIIFSLALASTSALAVKTKQCPSQLKYEITELEMTDGIANALDEWLPGEDSIAASVKLIEKFFSRSLYRGKLTLIESKDAVCKYATYGTRTRAKFYTKTGRNILRIAVPSVDNRDFGFYMTVGEYSSEGMTAKGKLAGVVFEVNPHNHNVTEFEETIDVGNAHLELK